MAMILADLQIIYPQECINRQKSQNFSLFFAFLCQKQQNTTERPCMFYTEFVNVKLYYLFTKTLLPMLQNQT